MREHAVPQNVTSYEFHLIGNMTLKQFLELAAGIVLAVIVYRTNLPNLIKIPIAVVSASIGAMIAFVPFEGRPLDRWFIAFVRAIYKPTEFYWRKTGHIPDFLTYTPSQKNTLVDEVDLTPYKRQRIMEFIGTLPANSQLQMIDLEETQRLNGLTSLFDEVEVTHDVVTAIPLEPEKPSVTLEPHVLKPIEQIQDTDLPRAVSIPEELTQTEPVQFDPQTIPVSLSPLPQSGILNNDQSFAQQEVVFEAQIQPQDTSQLAQSNQQTSQEVIIPGQDTIAVNPQQKPDANVSNVSNSSNSVDIFSAATPIQQVQPTQQATTSNTLPFPKKPTIPNLIVGMVFDPEGKIVDNAIVEITDMEGVPVRAVKSNSIGQFFITTPLKDGGYIVNTEKVGFHFPNLSLELKNDLVDPLSISADSIENLS